MPAPSATTMNATAQAAKAPAITTLHANAERPPMLWMTSTFSPTIAVSAIALSQPSFG